MKLNGDFWKMNTSYIDKQADKAYQDAVDYLMQQLPMFSRIGADAIKPGLENIIALCSGLGNPHLKFKSIHIAGTNGKGSTSHIMASALQHAGYKTGLYTSPHLTDLRERIRIDGIPVAKEFVIDFVAKTRALVQDIKPSYFELNVAMAFAAFADAGVDVAVIETGLGGRLDSTNIVMPVLSVITNISYDHVQVLGNTLPEIATEKAGIIKEKIPVVIGETHPETEPVFFKQSIIKQSPVYFADTIWDLVRIKQDIDFQYFKIVNKAEQKLYELKTDLLGDYQAHNIKTALAACAILNQSGWRLPPELVLESLQQVKRRTGLRGRWDRVSDNPGIILDVAHNPAGLQLAIDNLKQITEAPRIVVGFVKDKDVTAALKLLPSSGKYYFTQAAVPRALPASLLGELAGACGLEGSIYPDVAGAVSAALADLQHDETLLITGSFFIVGEAMSYLDTISPEKK